MAEYHIPKLTDGKLAPGVLPDGTGTDATTTTKGVIQLAGDLAGTADAPIVPGLAGKADAAHGHVLADISDYTAPDLSGLVETTDPRLSDARTPTAHSHIADDISDATAVGRSVLTATDAATARTAIGAGTSSLAVGAGPADAAAGDHDHDARYVRTVNGQGPDGSGDVAVAGGGGGLTQAQAEEVARDAVGAALVAGAGITITPDDGADTITIASSGGGSVADATTTTKGIVELATTAETTAGTDATRAVTPAGVKAVADTKAASSHQHSVADVTGLQASLHSHSNKAALDLVSGTNTGDQTLASLGAAPATHSHDVTDLTATGTRDATTFLRGDNTWATPAGGAGGDPSIPLAYPAGCYTAIPGYPVIARDISVPTSGNTARYFPMRLQVARTLASVGISVATLAAGSSVHVALYVDPAGTMQPGARVLALAAFDSSTTGPKIASSLALALPAGNYVWVITPAGGSPALLGYRVAAPMLGPTVSNQLADRFERAAAATPPPDPGEPWTAIGSGGNLFPAPLWLGWA